jgi:hypothetical protein
MNKSTWVACTSYMGTETPKPETLRNFTSVYLYSLKYLLWPSAHACNPATWEVEIGRIEVQGQPRQKV